jgi:AcrR family transcriptional regulator
MAKSSIPPGRRRFRGVEPDDRVAQRRQKLLEAGLEAFGTRGFHAVGVREICAIAKLTERYFYESFKNREALFQAVHDAEAKKVEDAMLLALANAAPEQKEIVRAVLRAVLSRYQDDPRTARVLLIEVIGVSSADQAFVTSQVFAQLIERMTLSFYPRLAALGVDTALLADGLYGATIYIAMRWTLGGFKQPLEQVVEHCALFYDSLLAELFQRQSAPPPPMPTTASTAGKADRKGARKSAPAPSKASRAQ